MAKPNTKAAPEGVPVAVPREIRGPLTPARCAKFVRQQIAARLPEICDGLLIKATKGDLAAVKALLQMAALDSGAGNSNNTPAAEPLVKQLAFVRKTLAELGQNRSA
jgi:hypothetical protein